MVCLIVCWMLIAAIPASLSAADAGAMLYGKGVLRNGVEIPNSSAVFSGDLLETRADSIANSNSLGSSVIISPTSLVQFQGQSLSVEHGSVSVATSHGISVRVRCMTIVPVTSSWTHFEVTDVNGTVEVAAKKNDVRLETVAMSGSSKEASPSSNNLREGEQTTRDEPDGCKGDKRKKDEGAVAAGRGGPLGGSRSRDFAAVGVAALALWLTTAHDDPPSPWKP
jgi:hypothetical protein